MRGKEDDTGRQRQREQQRDELGGVEGRATADADDKVRARRTPHVRCRVQARDRRVRRHARVVRVRLSVALECRHHRVQRAALRRRARARHQQRAVPQPRQPRRALSFHHALPVHQLRRHSVLSCKIFCLGKQCFNAFFLLHFYLC